LHERNRLAVVPGRINQTLGSLVDDLEPLAEAANDAQPHPSVIPAGFAVFAFSQALDRLHVAMREVEEIGMALARQLDFQALPGKAGEP
jgi:hypothetical protein